MSKNVVIFGPQGCGKTHHSKALAKHYGLKNIIDVDNIWRGSCPKGTLVLSFYGEDEAGKIARNIGGTAVPFETAMRSAGFTHAAGSRKVGIDQFPNWAPGK